MTEETTLFAAKRTDRYSLHSNRRSYGPTLAAANGSISRKDHVTRHVRGIGDDSMAASQSSRMTMFTEQHLSTKLDLSERRGGISGNPFDATKTASFPRPLGKDINDQTRTSSAFDSMPSGISRKRGRGTPMTSDRKILSKKARNATGQWSSLLCCHGGATDDEDDDVNYGDISNATEYRRILPDVQDGDDNTEGYVSNSKRTDRLDGKASPVSIRAENGNDLCWQVHDVIRSELMVVTAIAEEREIDEQGTLRFVHTVTEQRYECTSTTRAEGRLECVAGKINRGSDETWLDIVELTENSSAIVSRIATQQYTLRETRCCETLPLQEQQPLQKQQLQRQQRRRRRHQELNEEQPLEQTDMIRIPIIPVEQRQFYKQEEKQQQENLRERQKEKNGDDPMEWKVKRRADGTRYLTKRTSIIGSISTRCDPLGDQLQSKYTEHQKRHHQRRQRQRLLQRQLRLKLDQVSFDDNNDDDSPRGDRVKRQPGSDVHQRLQLRELLAVL